MKRQTVGERRFVVLDQLRIGLLDRWQENAIADIVFVARFSTRRRKYEIIEIRIGTVRQMVRQFIDKAGNHLHDAHTSCRLRVSDVQTRNCQINVSPPQSTQLTDSQSAQRESCQNCPTTNPLTVNARFSI